MQEKQLRFLSRFFKLIRFPNLIILTITQYLTAIFLVGPASSWTNYLLDTNLFLFVASTILVASAGYIINDYYDVRIDMVNKPDRVVISKELRRKDAIIIHFIFNSLGVFLATAANIWLGLITMFITFLLWLYSVSLKRTAFWGNFTVALLTASSVFLISFLYSKNYYFLILYSFFAFFISLIREIIKDVEDMKGDLNFGCKTLPLTWGARKTKTFLIILIGLFAVNLLWVTYALDSANLRFYLLFLLLPLAILAERLIRADSVKDYSRLSLLCKLVMIIGVSSMLFIN